jgi:plastocyanin
MTAVQLKIISGILALFVFAPLAMACDCTAGGCHCGSTCSCATTSPRIPPVTPPRDPAPLDDPPSNLTVNVAVANFSFTPANVTIHEGDSIEWDFLGGTHNAKSVFGSIDPFDSGFFSTGSYTRQFLIPGTFSYYCVPHGFDNFDGTAGGMAGTVNVLPIPEPGSIIALSAAVPAILIFRRRRTLVV